MKKMHLSNIEQKDIVQAKSKNYKQEILRWNGEKTHSASPL